MPHGKKLSNKPIRIIIDVERPTLSSILSRFVRPVFRGYNATVSTYPGTNKIYGIPIINLKTLDGNTTANKNSSIPETTMLQINMCDFIFIG